MKVVVRAAESVDIPGIDKLRILVRPDIQAHDIEWLSFIWGWLGNHPLADEMRRWVLDAEGEIVGHLAALPQYYRIEGRRVLAYAPAEYMVHPKYGFHALTLMRVFFRAVQNCVTCDTAKVVIDIETKFGAEEAGKLRFSGKLWNVAGVPNFPTWVPMPITQLFSWPLRAADKVLNDTARVGDLKVEELEKFDETFDELFEHVAAAVHCTPEKDMAFLRWRYGPGSPQASATLLAVRDGESLLGYAVLWTAMRSNNGYLLDLVAYPGRDDVARALLCKTSFHFRKLKASSVRYRFIDSATSPRLRDLWRLGFFLRSPRDLILLVKFKDSVTQEIANDTARWSYSFGDGEGTFWIR